MILKKTNIKTDPIMLKWTFLIAFSPDGQVICYSDGAEYDPFGFGDYDESDNDNVDCTNGFEGLVSQLNFLLFTASVSKISWILSKQERYETFPYWSQVRVSYCVKSLCSPQYY